MPSPRRPRLRATTSPETPFTLSIQGIATGWLVFKHDYRIRIDRGNLLDQLVLLSRKHEVRLVPASRQIRRAVFAFRAASMAAAWSRSRTSGRRPVQTQLHRGIGCINGSRHLDFVPPLAKLDGPAHVIQIVSRGKFIILGGKLHIAVDSALWLRRCGPISLPSMCSLARVPSALQVEPIQSVSRDADFTPPCRKLC